MSDCSESDLMCRYGFVILCLYFMIYMFIVYLLYLLHKFTGILLRFLIDFLYFCCKYSKLLLCTLSCCVVISKHYFKIPVITLIFI